MSTGASMLETSEGWLVKVEGVVTSIVTTGGDNSLYIDDGTGVAKVYVNGYVGDGTDNAAMLGAWDPAITVGDWVSAIGLASQDASGHRLRVRNTAEIVRASRASYTLAYTAGANGTITGTSPQTVDHGASGTLVTAVPNAGYHFVSWSDGILTAARTDTNVTADKTATANFTTAIDTFTLAYTAGANGTITGTTPQTVNHGANGTLVTAVPNAGYHFVKWSDNVMTASRTDTNVTANKTVTASFTTVIDAYTITVVSGLNGRILPGSGPIPHHTTRVFNILADTGYLIASVKVDGVLLVDVVNKRSYVVTFKKVEGPHTIAVTFKPGH